MSFGIVAGAAVGLVGAAMSADAAGGAAQMQADSANNATALQREMFERQQELQAPWHNAGIGGLNQLSYLMGLSPTGYGSPTMGGRGANAGPMQQSEESIRNRLRPRFMVTNPAAAAQGGFDPENGWTPGRGTEAMTTTNEAGLERAVQAALQAQQGRLDRFNRQAERRAQRDPEYGSLLDRFSMADFEADPGAEFRREQGEQGLERAAAASGGLGSGRYLRDAMRFNSGLASQEYGAAFDRFNVQNANRFNRLASIAGVGQTAANQTGAAAANFGAQAGSNMIGAGNAAASGRVGAANAWNGGLGQGISAYQNQQFMNMFQPRSAGSSGSWMPSSSGLSSGGSNFGGGGLMDDMQGYGVF
jgi:hypothetical protein